jgi:glucoamylase
MTGVAPIPDREPQSQPQAPGQPGSAPTWSSSAKDLIGCAMGPSRIWFTLGFGIVNEVYFPRVDLPQIRDLGFIVADGRGFWVEVKRQQNYSLELLAPGVPAVEIVHRHQRFQLTLKICPDPERDVLLIQASLEGDPDLLLYALLAPHIGASGFDNYAQVATVGARRVLGAEQGPFGLALAAVDAEQRDALGAASAGYVGVSDGWQDFDRNGVFTWRYDAAGPGNVALTAALPRQCVLGLGLGGSVQSAATLAISSLMQPFDDILERHIQNWVRWNDERNERSLLKLDASDDLARVFLLSPMVLRAHRDKIYPGAMVASVSVPWGNSRNDRGGYHLVWPRDLVECATALLALGGEHEARNTLRYLIATQKGDGSWSQNQWLGGTPYWNGVQLDEAAFPVLLAASLAERGALDGIEVEGMAAKAIGFIARTGPCTEQDRWEENAGVNPFSLTVAIAGLVAGARFVRDPARSFALTVADFWNSRIEEWLVATDNELVQRLGIGGCYVRVAPAAVLRDRGALSGVMQIRNRADGGTVPIEEEVSTDFLQLVRFGLRAPDDRWIQDSLKAADALLKVDTPNGPAWRRYNGDGYGEHADGAPYDGSGIGRAWPLLTGERGHYELVAGRDPTPYLAAMAAMSGPAGMIPEQVWDSAPIPARRLFPGRPTGSAMPLAWAHAEFIKLMISRDLGWPVDRPDAVWRRYGGRRPTRAAAVWRQDQPIEEIDRGAGLVITTPRPARVHWGIDGWMRVADIETSDTGLGLFAARIDPDLIGQARRIDFTFQWADDGTWIGRDFCVRLRESGPLG